MMWRWMKQWRTFFPACVMFAEPGGGGDPVPAGDDDPKPDPKPGKPAGDDDPKPNQDAEYWKAEAKKAAAERDRVNNEQRQLQAKLAEIEKAEKARAAAESAKEEDEKRKALEAQKEYVKAKEMMAEKHKQELETITVRARNAAIDRARSDMRVAISKIDGVVSGAVDEIASLLVAKVALDEDYKPFVVANDGKPRRDPEDPVKPFTMDQLAAEFIKERPWYLKSSLPAGSGAGNADDKAAVPWDIQKATTDMAYDLEWKKADPAGNKAAWAKFLQEAEAALTRKGR
ncbi:MAG TPA: hypothetical protein PKY77_05710 [Phycisphaerae bacterium]|nr:hypothetical protein [Phycisphaerae bacterium]HRY69060.1 hypothetical protein [Phycisphaerae bacterium]HSA25965.1 hypothetical protein [Phycisphaerae bacterium]